MEIYTLMIVDKLLKYFKYFTKYDASLGQHHTSGLDLYINYPCLRLAFNRRALTHSVQYANVGLDDIRV